MIKKPFSYTLYYRHSECRQLDSFFSSKFDTKFYLVHFSVYLKLVAVIKIQYLIKNYYKIVSILVIVIFWPNFFYFTFCY